MVVVSQVDNNGNQIIKLCMERNKHFKHIMTVDQIKQMTLIEDRFPLTKLPVCGSCEKLGFWGKGMMGVCKACGTITKNPITYSEYLSAGYDIDATGETAKSILRDEEKIRGIILPDHSAYIDKAKRSVENAKTN